jgi:predicted  nucleic acid-binding Zn-ribbon protein
VPLEVKLLENELLQKILDRLDCIETRISNIETKVENIDNRVANIEDKVTNIEGRVENIEGDISIIKADVVDLKKGQNRIEAKFNDFEVRNANNHIETMRTFQSINETLDFLTHKEHQTEKEVYTIKKRLEVIR